jgi:hypothetical protein
VSYVSAATPYPIYAWPRVPFWLVSVGAAAFIWLLCNRFDRVR